jgi:hypothetical protein
MPRTIPRYELPVAAGSVPLDLAGVRGAVISSLAALAPGSLAPVLVLDGLLRLEAIGSTAGALARITNASPAQLRWGEPGGESGVAPPGDAFELAVPAVGAAGVQLVVGDELPATLALSISESPRGAYLLAQAVVGG